MKKPLNTVITILSLWLITGFTLKFVFSDNTPKHISDVQMAEIFVKDHPKLKATWKQLSDGRIMIKPRKGKPCYLKDGVITSR